MHRVPAVLVQIFGGERAERDLLVKSIAKRPGRGGGRSAAFVARVWSMSITREPPPSTGEEPGYIVYQEEAGGGHASDY